MAEITDSTSAAPWTPNPATDSTAQPEPIVSDLGNDDDVDDARDRDIEAQLINTTSWLYRNINPILGIMVVLFSFMFFVYILNFDYAAQPARKDIVIYLLSTVSGIVGLVIGYFFGSSKGSSDKNSTIHSQMRRKPPA